MSDDLDELDAALRRAMAALDGDAPAGYFEALPGRTLARLDDPAIGELPDEPARPLRAVQGLRPPADADADDGDSGEDDDAVFSSQIMAAVELPDVAELAEPAPPDALPRRDRASESSAILRAVEGAASGAARAEGRREPASASSVGMRAVAVEVGASEPGDPRETGVAGSDLAARSARSRIMGLAVPPVEPARPEPAVAARPTGAAASMTEAGRGLRSRRVRAAILGVGGIGLAAVAVIYLRAGDHAPRSAASSVPSVVPTPGATSPSAGGRTSESSLAAESAASAGGGAVVSARPAGSAGGSGAGSAATTAAAAGSGVVPGRVSGPLAGTGKLGEILKHPDDARPLTKSGGGKPEVKRGPGATGKGGGAAKQGGTGADEPDRSEAPGKKLKSSKPRPDRTSLSGDDIERAMTAVAGQARACFAGTRGTASLRLTVAPSGRIAQVAVTGPFAGTPEGACVERVVQAATFPPWSGGPQSFDYSYLLSD